MSVDDAALLSVLGVTLGGIVVALVLWLWSFWKKRTRERDDENWP